MSLPPSNVEVAKEVLSGQSQEGSDPGKKQQGSQWPDRKADTEGSRAPWRRLKCLSQSHSRVPRATQDPEPPSSPSSVSSEPGGLLSCIRLRCSLLLCMEQYETHPKHPHSVSSRFHPSLMNEPNDSFARGPRPLPSNRRPKA